MNEFCIVCGKELVKGQRKLCSEECRREWTTEYNYKWRQNNQEKIKKDNHRHYQNSREKILENKRKYRQDNQSEMREHERKYRQNNLERARERDRKHYQNNREKILEQKRGYYRNNREKILEQKHKHRQNNLEKARENDREWYQNNTEKANRSTRKYYRRVRGLPEDWNLSKESSIEVIMRRWLQDFDIVFIEQYHINLGILTYTRIDFYIPEAHVCLYVDGDYWHSLPEAQERDARINSVLETMGYTVIRLSEGDILAGVRPIEILETAQ